MVQAVWLGEVLDGAVRLQEEVRRLAEGSLPVRNRRELLVDQTLASGAVSELGGGGGIASVDEQADLLHLSDSQATGDRETQA